MYWLSMLSVLAAVPLGLATPTLPRWDDMRLKHSWDSIPEKWEYQGHPPAGMTIDLRIALKPHRENALIDALYEVSDPGHSRYVSIPLYLCKHLLTHAYVYAALKIRCAPIPGASRRARRSSSGHTGTCWFLACTPRGPICIDLDHAWRGLVDSLQCVHNSSKCPPWCNIPTLPAHRDERDDHSHNWLRASRRIARARADRRTDDVLRFAACPPVNLESDVEWPDPPQR